MRTSKDLIGKLNYNDVFSLRVQAAKLLVAWNCETPVNRLLNYENWYDMTEEHIRALQLIVGPNGYAIYKALRAKLEEKQ